LLRQNLGVVFAPSSKKPQVVMLNSLSLVFW
jgi:hypothetical protein